MTKPPDRIAINHDEYHTTHVGLRADGSQFFLTQPFLPKTSVNDGREFLALYLFDGRGRFLEARIDDLGPRDAVNQEHARHVFEQRLAELGRVEYRRIEVQPFQVEHLGTIFGLVPRPPEREGDGWWVELLPGNYMAFHEPWDSGDYAT